MQRIMATGDVSSRARHKACCGAEPMVRIRFPPADSPSLAGFLLPVSKSRQLPRGGRARPGSTASRDAQGSSTSRQLPVISLSGTNPVPQCRLGALEPGCTAAPRGSDKRCHQALSSVSSGKAEHGLLLVPAKWQTRMRQQLVCGQIGRLASVEDGFGDVRGEIAEADEPREIGRAHPFPLGQCGKRHAVAAHECSVEPARPDQQLDEAGMRLGSTIIKTVPCAVRRSIPQQNPSSGITRKPPPTPNSPPSRPAIPPRPAAAAIRIAVAIIREDANGSSPEEDRSAKRFTAPDKQPPEMRLVPIQPDPISHS